MFTRWKVRNLVLADAEPGKGRALILELDDPNNTRCVWFGDLVFEEICLTNRSGEPFETGFMLRLFPAYGTGTVLKVVVQPPPAPEFLRDR